MDGRSGMDASLAQEASEDTAMAGSPGLAVRRKELGELSEGKVRGPEETMCQDDTTAHRAVCAVFSQRTINVDFWLKIKEGLLRNTSCPTPRWATAFVSWSCCNNVSQTGWFKTTRVYWVTDLEARNPKIKVLIELVASEDHEGESIPCLSPSFWGCGQSSAFLGW